MISTIFTQISATALIRFFNPQVRRFFQGGVHLKVGRDKELYYRVRTVLKSP